MSNPIRPSDCPSVPGPLAHFRVSRYFLPGKDTKEGKGAGPATVRGQATEDTAQQTADRQLVLAALRTLSAEHRQVLLECYFRGASAAEAAETLGVPLGTVKLRTYDALHALRQEIGMKYHADEQARHGGRPG
jgi:DNA-directed RNA polymerase specialized sigma24 family protein